MRNSLALTIIFLLFGLIACKNDKKVNSTNVNSPTVKVDNDGNVTTEKFANIPGPAVSTSLRKKGKSLIDYRREHAEKPFWPIIEHGVWQFMFVFNGNSMEKPSEKIIKWIDFKQDGTFDYGEGSKVVTSGIYQYTQGKSQLVILDNDKRTGPNGWSVNLVGSAMVLLGNAELASNAYQIKLEKLMSRPK